jgi:hypothetical protein
MVMRVSRRYAAQARSPRPRARPFATASTPAATAKPTERCTSSLSAVCATATAPAPMRNDTPAKAIPTRDHALPQALYRS